VAWVYPYEEEYRPPSDLVLGKAVLRPAVFVQLAGPLGTSYTMQALVDSGASYVLTPEWVALQLGVVPDEAREISIQLGGASRRIRFAEATVRLCAPATEPGDTDATIVHEWDTTVGFYMNWDDPPWLVVLGQVGFFDQFTVSMSRLAQRVALESMDEFDTRFPPEPDTATDRSARFDP
jgi:hypothetical protein